mmetsp:Transcript_1941/g.1848  ORF Transcript_1941/g.1848 Transcript_1941/m.1848 type:complete len:101 (-) Transcript_1941:40-342(-)
MVKQTRVKNTKVKKSMAKTQTIRACSLKVNNPTGRTLQENRISTRRTFSVDEEEKQRETTTAKNTPRYTKSQTDRSHVSNNGYNCSTLINVLENKEDSED